MIKLQQILWSLAVSYNNSPRVPRFASGVVRPGALTYLCGSVRCYHLPSRPFSEYKVIGALVIKDRSPVGKFKFKPSAQGIVTVFIAVMGLFANDSSSFFSVFYSDRDRLLAIKNAFTSHLDDGVNYSLHLVARKGKHNVTFSYEPRSLLNKEFLTQEYLEIFN